MSVVVRIARHAVGDRPTVQQGGIHPQRASTTTTAAAATPHEKALNVVGGLGGSHLSGQLVVVVVVEITKSIPGVVGAKTVARPGVHSSAVVRFFCPSLRATVAHWRSVLKSGLRRVCLGDFCCRLLRRCLREKMSESAHIC